MSEEIKFPFQANERTQQAFRHAHAQKKAMEMIIKTLVEVASQIDSPWDVLLEEYPEIKEYGLLNYDFGKNEIYLNNKKQATD